MTGHVATHHQQVSLAMSQRPRGVICLGMAAIVIGAAMLTISFSFSLAIREILSAVAVKHSMAPVVVGVVGVSLGSASVVVGIGMLRLCAWARQAFLGLTGVSVVLNTLMLWSLPFATPFTAHRVPLADLLRGDIVLSNGSTAPVVLVLVVSFSILLIPHLLVFNYLHSPNVRAQFRGEHG